MITKNISAPVGAGITRFVAELAFQHCAPDNRKLIVIARPEMQEQWRRALSDAEVQAEFITYQKWQRLAVVDPAGLIVFTEHSTSFYWRAAGTLQECGAEVWTVNAPEQAFRPF